MGLLDKLLATGGAVLFGAIAHSAYGNARETQRRKNSPLNFNDGVTQSEFMAIVWDAAKRTPRLENVAVTGMTVTLDVRSNSGLSNWEAEIDFNDYGHLTGAYWLQTENSDSLIPEHFADAVRTQIQRRVDVGSKASSQGAHATTSPPRWHPDPYPSSPPNRLRWWDGERWTEHTALPRGQGWR